MTATFEGDPSRAARGLELALSPAVAGVLATGGLEIITSALRPYALQAQVSAAGARVRGQSLAVELFAKLIEQLEAAASDGPLSAADLGRFTDEFLETQLKFDLAFVCRAYPMRCGR